MTHVNIGKMHPGSYRAMTELNDRAVEGARDAGLDHGLIELVKIRAS